MKIFNFALVGAGHIASRHIKFIKDFGHLQAIVDADPAVLQNWKSQLSCEIYSNLDQLFSSSSAKIDILVICSPNGYHFSHAKAGLLNGCHIICEKPLTLKTTDAILLYQLAAQQQKMLFTVQSMRYNPLVKLLYSAFQEHRFGKILGFQMQCLWHRPTSYYKSAWKGTQSLDGGILFTQFSHYIDVLQWLFGEIVDAQGIRQNILHKEVIDFEDQGVAQISTNKFIHGGLYWSINTHQQNYEIGLTIHCEQLTLRLGGSYLHQLIYCTDPHFEKELRLAEKSIDTTHLSFHEEVYKDAIHRLASHPTENPQDDMIKTIRSIETIYQSTPLI